MKSIHKDFGSYIYSNTYLKINETDFLLNIVGIASYRVQNGDKVIVYPFANADESSIRFFLNGSVLGAMLHQQGKLPLHGSSFKYRNKGVTICGRSGTGKSSLTVAFCQNGGQFICDDITPIKINEEETSILPIETHIKLWDDALQKLKIENNGLEKIRPMLNKFYIPSKEALLNEQRLDIIFILSTHNKYEFLVNELTGIAKYNALRKQIYRKIYLKGMPETDKIYFRQLFFLASKVKVMHVIRPRFCDIYETMNVIETEIIR